MAEPKQPSARAHAASSHLAALDRFCVGSRDRARAMVATWLALHRLGRSDARMVYILKLGLVLS